MQDSLLIFVKTLKLTNAVLTAFWVKSLSYFGIIFVITMDNNVKKSVTLAILRRLINKHTKIFRKCLTTSPMIHNRNLSGFLLARRV